MRTSIDIDDQLLDAILKETGAPNHRAAVEEALRTFLQLQRQRRILAQHGAFPNLQNIRDLGGETG